MRNGLHHLTATMETGMLITIEITIIMDMAMLTAAMYMAA